MKNKRLKATIVLFFCLISIVIAGYIHKSDLDARTKERYEMDTYFTPFRLPDTVLDEERNAEVHSMLKEISSEMNINFLSRTTNYTAERNASGEVDAAKDKIEVDYFLFNTVFSSLLKQFGVSPFIIDSSDTLSTGENDPLKNILLSSNSPEVTFSIREISNMDSYNFSSLFLETKDAGQYNAFLEKLTRKYNDEYLTNFTVNDFEAFYEPETLELTTYTRLNEMLIASSIFLMIFSMIWLLENTNAIAIYRLYGYSTFAVFKSMLVKKIAGMSVFILAVMSLFLFNGINLRYLFWQSLLTISYLLVLYVLLMMINSFSVINQLNKKSYSTKLLLPLYGLKIILLVSCMSIVFPLAELFQLSIATTNTSEKLENYGVFFPTYVGKDYKGLVNNDNGEVNYGLSDSELYDYLDEKGSLLIDTFNYYYQLEELSRTIIVNPNYLNTFPIESITGTKVVIDRLETSKVVLIPDRLSGQYEAIKTVFSQMYGVSDEEIEFYIINDQQNIVAFDHENETIPIPNVIEVQTIKNSTSGRRSFVTGSGFEDPVKVRIETSANEMYEEMIPLLKKAGLDDNYLSLVSTSEIKQTSILIQIGEIQKYLLEIFFGISLVLSLILYIGFIYFKVNKQRFIVWRLNGVSFFKTYKPILLLTLAQYAALFSYAFFSKAVYSLMVICLAFFMIELTVLTATLLYLETQDKATILKGE